MPYAGEVDICPCFSIEFHDLHHLIDMVKSGKDWLPDCREFHDHDMFRVLRFSDVHKGIGHDCAFIQHPLAKVQTTTTLYIYEPTQSLRVMTSYVIHTSKDISSQFLQI